MDAETITITVNEQMNYDDLNRHNPDDFWSLLLHTGYLTPVQNLEKNIYAVRLPNQEIRECFKQNIIDSFRFSQTTQNLTVDLLNAILTGDAQKIQTTLHQVTRTFVSIRDTATKAPKEMLYQGFFEGMAVSWSGQIENFSANAESGDGYADILFESADYTTGVVIELKASNKPADLEKDAQDAIRQIHEKRYVEKLKEWATPVRWGIGIASYRKQCRVVVEALD